MASRILLADDSITIQKVVNLTFADEGIEVVAVSNGDLAERRLAEVKPDLVLADIFMPGKNGYELCEAIKGSSHFSKVPVVLLVGAFEPFDQTEARRVGADAHLTKPFESRTLVETVRSLISANWQTAASPSTQMPATDEGRDGASPGTAGLTPSPVASHLAGMDLSAMDATSDLSSTPQVRNTGELGSPSVPQPHVLDRAVIEAPAQNAVSPILTDTIDRFEPLEFSPVGDFLPADVASPLELGTPDAHSYEGIHSFDEPNPLEEDPSQEPASNEAMPMSALHEVNISGAGEGEQWFDSGFETSRLDQTIGEVDWRAPVTGSPLSQSPNFALQGEADYRASDSATETACATLLAVDEPLGDVLYDEGVSVDALTSLEVAPSDSLGLELGEVEVAEPRPASSTQFDLVEVTEAPLAGAQNTITAEQAPTGVVEHSVADAAEQTSSVGEASADTVEFGWAEVAENASADAAEQASAQTEPVAPEEAWVPEYSGESNTATPPPGSLPVSNDVAGDSDWTTPRAASYSTAQLESVVMPVDTGWAAEDSGSEEAQQPENTSEAAFRTPASWSEEEARFSPIDIEGVAVEDASLGDSSPLAPVCAPELTTPEEPAEGGETLVARSAEESSNQSPVAALSPAAIDEIVRRVVAQMSESVVREVAWEVVPDCVERVIDQLTRESLSKRA
jgi:CheY-like chemotaxis protein